VIFINGRFLTQKITGVNRYAIGICDAFKQLNVEFTLVLPAWFNGVVNYPFVKYGNLRSHFWEQVNLHSFLKKNNNPLLLNFTGLGPVYYKNQFSTIHDLGFMRHPEWFSSAYRYYYKALTPIMAKNARKIITVSEFSKKEIVTLLHKQPNDIIIAGLAPSKLTSDSDEKPVPHYDLPKKYILAVSSIEPRKNFKRLLDAFKKIKDSDYSLLVVGGGASHFANDGLSITGTDRVIFKGYVDDAMLEVLYKQATAFIYPSLYEGFGIPPIEAMCYGCPVIVSDIEVLKETCTDAALYANPYDEDDIAATIDRLINDDRLRQDLAERGKKNIARFSFLNSAAKILEAI